jgi:hypothetical protein
MKTEEQDTQQIIEEVAEIEALSHIEMARLWRYAPIGHRYFDKRFAYFEIFRARFKKLGGMTTAVSKAIG